MEKIFLSHFGTNEDQLRTTLVHCFLLWQLFINKDSNFHSNTRSQCCKFAVSHSIISFERGDNLKLESTHFVKTNEYADSVLSDTDHEQLAIACLVLFC